MANESKEERLGSALGRVPSGLFIVTAEDERGVPMGFLASFVQQVALDPPTIAIAISSDRDHLEQIRSAGRFGVSVLGEEDKHLMKPFFRGPDEASPFEDVSSTRTERGARVLTDALAWLDCRVSGEHNAGDHMVVFGVVEEGERLRDGAPLTHTRRSGLRYS